MDRANFLRVALHFMLLGFFGCGERITPCNPEIENMLSFNYSGHKEGTYSGSVENADTLVRWPRAERVEKDGFNLIVIASSHIGTADLDLFQFHIPDQGTGNFHLPTEGGTDAVAFDLLGSPLVYHFVSSEVNVDFYECDRIKGTFQGELLRTGVDSLKITDGIFDLKITRD